MLKKINFCIGHAKIVDFLFFLGCAAPRLLRRLKGRVAALLRVRCSLIPSRFALGTAAARQPFASLAHFSHNKKHKNGSHALEI
jgi:hypothetical protein